MKNINCLIKHYAVKTYGEWSYSSTDSYLTSALDRDEWSASRLARFTQGKDTGTHCMGGWVGSRAGLNDRNSIPGRGRDFFLFATASRQAVMSTQSPIQWVPGTLSPRVKRLGRKIDH
jgi:hypothetical protein